MISTLIPLELSYPHAIDFYSIQAYRGSSFGSLFNEYKKFQSLTHSTKPLFLSEYGYDALDWRIAAGATNESMQSHALIALTREVNVTIDSNDHSNML